MFFCVLLVWHVFEIHLFSWYVSVVNSFLLLNRFHWMTIYKNVPSIYWLINIWMFIFGPSWIKLVGIFTYKKKKKKKIIFPQDFEGIFSVSFNIWCSAWEFQYNSNPFACTTPLPLFPLWKFLHSLSWMLVDICDDTCSIGLLIVWAFSGFS